LVLILLLLLLVLLLLLHLLLLLLLAQIVLAPPLKEALIFRARVDANEVALQLLRREESGARP
jgi:hypothetical protein